MNSKPENIRNSSVELLKLFAIVIIVLSHVIQTLRTYPQVDFFLPIGYATHDIKLLALSILQYCGSFGNTIFLLCSIYFLSGSKAIKKEKFIQLILDVWVISVLIFCSVYFCSNIEIKDKGLIIKQFFPISFSNNWFITCYLILYAIHPALNSIINYLDRNTFKWILGFLSILYIGINFILPEKLFYSSIIIVWVVIYLIFGYIKKYIPNYSSNSKINLALIIIGILGNIFLIILTNFLGLHTSLFSHSDSLIRWNSPSNPFILIASFGLVNIATEIKTYNRSINCLASLSLFIYIIHENEILRTYTRPLIWEYVYQSFGYQHIFMWVLIITFAILFISIALSFLYKYTIRRLTSYFTKALVNNNDINRI